MFKWMIFFGRFERHIISNLSEIFLISSSVSKTFKYIGLNVVVPQSRRVSCQESEKTEYRALIGQLNWIATQTRPDIVFDVCQLSVSSSRATIRDLLRLCKDSADYL